MLSNTHLLLSSRRYAHASVHVPIGWPYTKRTARSGMPAGGYVVGAINTNSCPVGSTVISSSATCTAAAVALGTTFAQLSNNPAYPAGCFKLVTDGLLYRNIQPVGSASPSAIPVCAAAGAPHPCLCALTIPCVCVAGWSAAGFTLSPTAVGAPSALEGPVATAHLSRSMHDRVGARTHAHARACTHAYVHARTLPFGRVRARPRCPLPIARCAVTHAPTSVGDTGPPTRAPTTAAPTRAPNVADASGTECESAPSSVARTPTASPHARVCRGLRVRCLRQQ